MSSGNRHFRWPLLLRLFVGIGLLFLLMFYIDLEPILESILEARPTWILMGVLFVFAGNLISSGKLWLLDRALGGQHEYSELVLIYYIGIFFNNFLPTTVGGDLMKIRKLSSKLDVSKSTGAVFVSRVFGLITLYGMATITVLVRPNILNVLGARWFSLPLLGGAIVLFLTLTLIFFYGRQAFGWIPISMVRQFCDDFLNGLNVTGYRYNFLGLLFGFSVVFHVLNCLAYWSLVRAVGGAVPVLSLFLVVPLVTFISMIPWSIGALGVRETAITFFFVALSLTPAQAFSIAVIFRLISYLNSFVGGIFYIFYDDRNTNMAQ